MYISPTASARAQAIGVFTYILREASALSVLLQWALPEPLTVGQTASMALTLFPLLIRNLPRCEPHGIYYMNIPFFKNSKSKKIKEIDMLLDRLRKIADAIEPVDKMMSEFDTTLRDLLRVTRIIEADEVFIKLDRQKVLSDDDDCGDGGMPYSALCKSLRKINEDDNPVMYPCEVYSRIYGLILALEEYKKYCK